MERRLPRTFAPATLRHDAVVWRQALTWALVCALGAAAGAGALAAHLDLRAGPAALGAALICTAGAGLILRALPDAHPHARLGPGNRLTMARGAAVAALGGVALVGGPGLSWAVLGVALAAVAADGVDGWAARRAGLASAFGARLDVEVDVVFALVLAVLAWQTGQVGAWFLALPALRPAFLLAGRVWPALRAPLPPSRRRPWVAGVQYGVQVALLAPPLPAGIAAPLGAALLALVVGSFAVDVAHLARAAR